MPEALITLILPYYRQEAMLLKQMDVLDTYPSGVRDALYVIVVDDCSPEDAEHVLTAVREDGHLPHRPDALYRIDKDVAWNRGMARNLGAKMATTPWLMQVDLDHILTAQNAANLLTTVRSFRGVVPQWFRFARRRIGAADETRMKDAVPRDATDVLIHPHIDSYLCTPRAYWRAGGYNEDFSGVLGGGTPFLKEMERVNGPPGIVNSELHVHTRHSVPDSSEHTLPRDPKAFKQRKHEIMAAHGTLRGHDPLRVPWHKVDWEKRRGI